MATRKQVMGKMKLSNFGPSANVEMEPSEQPAAIADPIPKGKQEPNQDTRAKSGKRKPAKKEDRFVTVNIKILESQQEWLADTAKQVRQNNEAPVPASDRVYPQHLIQTAIDLLKSAEVDWGQVKNVEGLRQALKL